MSAPSNVSEEQGRTLDLCSSIVTINTDLSASKSRNARVRHRSHRRGALGVAVIVVDHSQASPPTLVASDSGSRQSQPPPRRRAGSATKAAPHPTQPKLRSTALLQVAIRASRSAAPIIGSKRTSSSSAPPARSRNPKTRWRDPRQRPLREPWFPRTGDAPPVSPECPPGTPAGAR